MFKYSILFFLCISTFLACNEDLKKRTILNETTDSIQVSDSISMDTIEEKTFSIEEIAALANEGKLETVFSAADFKKNTLENTEGTVKTTVLFIYPKTKDEVRIDFQPENPTAVWRVTIDNPNSKFYSESGVKPGMRLEDLNSLNNKPVDFYGFEWDLGGAVNFNNGVLEMKNIFVYLKTDKKYGEEFIGDMPHSSEDAQAKELELYVFKITYEARKIIQSI